MSAILTEPAKDTVKEYEEMKKLIIPKSAGRINIYMYIFIHIILRHWIFN